MAFESFLPKFVGAQGRLTTLLITLDWVFLVLLVAGAILSTQRYRQGGDPLFGYVAIAQIALAFVVITAIIGAKRYDLWYYLSRIILAGGFLILLFGLLADYVRLYRREYEKTLDLNDRNARLALLSDAAVELLRGSDPQVFLGRLFQRLSTLLGLEIYVYYRLSADGKFLELTGLGGMAENQFESLRRQALGQAICGTVALTRAGKVAEDIQHHPDPQTDHIRALGISAYACYPLQSQERLYGTLSFGTRGLSHFDPDALDLIQVVSNLVVTAIERNLAESSLQEYAADLERSNRDLQEFAFVASHDLQEPLRKIGVFGDMLLEGANNLDEQQRDTLTRMRTSANRMRSMVDGLLQLSRLETHAQPFQPVDLNQVLREVLADLELQIRRMKGAVEICDLPVIEADSAQMRRLFQNLIGNALKFQPPGGTPRVKVDAETLEPGSVQVRVADNGIGFDEAHAGHLFEPFKRLVGRIEYEGSGMGLAICRKIVERHQGQITARSKRGQGTTFLVTLPMHQNHTKHTIQRVRDNGGSADVSDR